MRGGNAIYYVARYSRYSLHDSVVLSVTVINSGWPSILSEVSTTRSQCWHVPADAITIVHASHHKYTICAGILPSPTRRLVLATRRSSQFGEILVGLSLASRTGCPTTNLVNHQGALGSQMRSWARLRPQCNAGPGLPGQYAIIPMIFVW